MANRKTVLLKAALDILVHQARTGESVTELHASYDGTDCDGQCLIEDIADELGVERPDL